MKRNTIGNENGINEPQAMVAGAASRPGVNARKQTMRQSMRFMKTIRRLSLAMLAFGLLAIAATTARADDCVALGGAIVAGECQISSPVARTGVYNLDETLHVLGTGRIDASHIDELGITLNICVGSGPCDLILDMPTVAGGGQIEANDTGASGNGGGPITINLSGNVLMQAGSGIFANNTGDGGAAGDITITAGGDMTMCGPAGAQTGCGGPSANVGARIAATNLPTTNNVGGNITIIVGDATKVTGRFYMEGGDNAYGAETGATIDATSAARRAGTVGDPRVKSGDITIRPGGSYFSEPGSAVVSGGYSGTATQQGGKIFIVSGCGLTTEGRITSKGPDFGADLVHLEGCEVIVRGLVESTGKGHVADAPNSCDNVDDDLIAEEFRAGKPANATGCVEVWGKVITIDSSLINPIIPQAGSWAGELNADIGNGGAAGTSWIDIFAFSKLTVTDGTGNDRKSNNLGHEYFSTYAVHANAIDGSDHTPGVVTAKVKSGPLTASGKAFEASSTMTADTGHPVQPGPDDGQFVGNGSDGGTIDVEASGTVTLDNAWLNASGDFSGGPPCPSGSGACGAGGHIIVKAWGIGSDISWQNGDGNIGTANDSLDPPPPAIPGGDIILGACDTIDTTGTNFHGEVPSTSTGGANCDLSKPDIPVYNTEADGSGDPVNVFNQDVWALCDASSIGGIKFNDANGNGVRDGDPLENVAEDWEIKIWDATQTTLLGTTTTAADGSYSFNVAPGSSYVICETLQNGWQQTAPVAGSGVVACNSGGLGYIVDLTEGECCQGTSVTGKDFGNMLIQFATKSGTKWNDKNGNHVRDAGDDGIDGWVIHLFGTAAADGSAVHQTATTSGGGNYTFTVMPGSYTVCEQGQAGWTQTYPTSGAACTAGGDPNGDNPTPGPIGYAINLNAGDNDIGNDFGNIQLATKSGTKWNDKNGNHLRDGGDVGIDGWVIHLFGTAVNGSAVHQTATTSGGGNYSFTVLPGSYTVCEQGQAGWNQTYPTVGAACTAGGDPAADNPTPGPIGYAINLNGGDSDTGNDFGNIQLATKSGTKWNDKNGNHVRDAGDDGINGWVIHLFGTAVNGSAVHQTATTSGGGNYSFTVLPGSYKVCEQGQAGWAQTYPTVGTACTAAGDPAADNPTPGPIGYAIILNGGDSDTGNDFGNTQPPCLGGGGGLTLGFWSNKNGGNVITSKALLAGVLALCLRKADGSLLGNVTLAKFQSFLTDANASNMANMLSAQLAAMYLNVASGGVNGNALIYAPGTLSANALGFATVNAVMAEASALLCTGGATKLVILSGNPLRARAEALKTALDKANNNLNFQQSTPCAFRLAL